MIIKNASVYTEDGIFLEKDIYIEDNRFVDCAEKVSDKTEIDAEGCVAIPGLTDIHSTRSRYLLTFIVLGSPGHGGLGHSMAACT